MNLYKLNLKLFAIILFTSSQISLISSELDNSKETQNNSNNIDILIQEDVHITNTIKQKTIDYDSEKSDLIIPKNSAIVASNLMEIVLDPDRKYPMPITLVTELPVFAKSGKVVFPKKTLI